MLDVGDGECSVDIYVAARRMTKGSVKQIVAEHHFDFEGRRVAKSELEKIGVYFEGKRPKDYEGRGNYTVDVHDKGLIGDEQIRVLNKFMKRKVVVV